MNINFRKYLIILLGALFLNSCSLLTRSGISNTSKIYYSDDVNFYYDLTYRKDNKVNYERQIWKKAYKMLDESQDFFLMDVFTFNDFIKKEFAEKVDPIYIGKEFADKILEKRKKDPNVEIYLILDENNTFYGAFDNETHEKLRKAGVKIGYTDLSKLNDPISLYSSVWRIFIQPFGNPKNIGTKTNPLYPDEKKVTMRSILRAANGKANHRKVIMNEKEVLLPSANPHAEGSRHSNIAFSFSSPIIKEIYDFENDSAKLTKKDGDISDGLPEKIFNIPESNNNKISLQYFTEGKIGRTITDEIKNTVAGEEIQIAQFFLSDNRVIKALKAASNRGVTVKLILNNSPAGLPNKAASGEIMKGTNRKAQIRFYNKGAEEFHSKLLLFLKKDNLVIYGGSSNLTRRNLRNYNLEDEIKITASYDQNISKEVLDYFDRLWTNRDGDFTLPYDDWKNEKFTNYMLFRIMESTGFGIF